MNLLLDDVVAEIADAPHAAASLTLYALVSTLEFERSGHLFRLAKLRDLSAGQRRLAYGLMDMMAEGRNSGQVWASAKARMDELVGAG